VGDLVRVKLSSLYSKIRRTIKEGNKKLLVTNYTPEVYKIRSVVQLSSPNDIDFRPNQVYTIQTLTNPSKVVNYQKDITLRDDATGRQRYSTTEPMRFFAKDFIKVDTDDKPYSNRDVIKLNDFYAKLGLIPPAETAAQLKKRQAKTTSGATQAVIQRATANPNAPKEQRQRKPTEKTKGLTIGGREI
jgi:hypothetical protein